MNEKTNHNPIFLCGSFHGNNIGDLAIANSMINELQDNYQLNILTKNPDKLSELIGNKDSIKFTKATNPFHILSSIIKSNIIIIGGGGLFFDKGLLDYLNPLKGSQLMVWLTISLLSKLMLKKIYWLGVGFGPLSIFGKIKIKLLLPLIDGIYVRDKSSIDLLINEIKYNKAQKTADVVLLNKKVDEIKFKYLEIQKEIKALIILKKGQNSQIKETVGSLLKIKEKFSDIQFRLISTNPKDDNNYLSKLAEESGLELIDTTDMTEQQFRKEVGKYDLIISQRMHGLIIGLQEGLTGIGIAITKKDSKYLDKVRQFQESMYDEFIFVNKMEVKELTDKINYLLYNNHELIERVKQNYQNMYKLAKNNFKNFF